MSTTSTAYSWFWYIRKKGKNWVLGLVNEDGDAPTTADLDIEYWYNEIPDEVKAPVQLVLGLTQPDENQNRKRLERDRHHVSDAL